VRNSKSLSDAFYDTQVERLSSLDRFPLLPAGQKELRQTLRRVSNNDPKFVERLISGLVDSRTISPKPTEILQYAAELRQSMESSRPSGDPNCPKCHGSGWESFVKPVKVGEMPQYDAAFSRRCYCRKESVV